MGLLIDLASRFDDPIYLFDAGGSFRVILSNGELSDPADPQFPASRANSLSQLSLEEDSLIVVLEGVEDQASFAMAPIYDEAGLPAGGFLVTPLDATISAELSGPREAYIRALWMVVIAAIVAALLIGSYLTWVIVRPLRNITDGIAAIGEGEYSRRLAAGSRDEFGRLAISVNAMAESIEGIIEALEKSDKTRRQMVANMGHDLRTPLAAMLGYLEEGLRYLDEKRFDQSEEALIVAQTQGNRLQQLVDDLFELSVLDSIPPPIRQEPVPLGELLTEAARFHSRLFTEASIKFDVDIEKGLPSISGDGVRLLRLLNNLLSNARTHTPEAGTVTLSGRKVDDCVQISVSDTGRGIDPDELESLFQRHVGHDSPRTRKESGTGLGLAISRGIAVAHGGTLEVTQSGSDGTTFVLTLPASHPP
jgi:signal transduction histidine kinase